MTEANGIDIHRAPPEEERPWLLTNGPFEIDKSTVDPATLKTVSWERIKYQLGFQEEELTEWREKQFPILEIGPGNGVSSQQLLHKGINLFVLEPSLRYAGSVRAKARFLTEQFQGRVSAANAADASLAFPNQKFQVAFAIGVNFQDHAQSPLALLNQIGGVVAALEDNNDSYLAFETSQDGTLGIRTRNRIGADSRFNLTQFLDENNIRYAPLTKYLGRADHPSIIRIFKRSQNGQDATKKIDNALKANLSHYTHQGH